MTGNSFQFTILGCGSSTGVPLPGCHCPTCQSEDPKDRRMKSSALISLEDGRNILIDTSTDLRHQALRFGIERIDAVLFTHHHADHILGLDDLRAFNFIQKQQIPCYGSRETLETLKKVFAYTFFPEKDYLGGGLAQLSLHEFDLDATLSLFDLSIDVFALKHGNLDVAGFRLGNIAYATDCNVLSERAKECIRGVDTLFLDGLREKPHGSHFSLDEASALGPELEAKKTYLVHMAHNVCYAETNPKLPDSVELAFDGLKVEGRY